jgi:hypothetical protein
MNGHADNSERSVSQESKGADGNDEVNVVGDEISAGPSMKRRKIVENERKAPRFPLLYFFGIFEREV